MAVAVASYSRSTDDSSDAVVTRPPGVTAGDFLVAFAVVAYANQTGGATRLSAPPGWVTAAEHDNGEQCGKVFTRIATASESATYLFPWSGSTAVVKGVAIARVTGARLAAPFQAPPAIRGSTTTGTDYPVPGFTAAAAGVALIGGSAHAYTGTFTATPPPGFTTTLPASYAQQQPVVLAAKTVPTAGAQGPWVIDTNFNAGNAQGDTTFSAFLVGESLLALAGSVAVTGSVVKTGPSKLLGGAVAVAGALGTQKLVLRALEGFLGAFGPAGDTLEDELTDAVAGTTVPPLSGAVVRTVTKPLTGQVTTSGVARSLATKALGGAAAVTGALLRRPVRVLAGTVAVRGALVTRFLGRVFGRPGIVRVTVRAVGEVRVRLRRS